MDRPSRLNHLTFSGPVGLPGVTLAAGTYVFEVAEINPQIVRVLSRDGSSLYFTGFTQTVRRPASRGAREVTFAEAQPGIAPRIAAWYPVGAPRGYQFLYESK